MIRPTAIAIFALYAIVTSGAQYVDSDVDYISEYEYESSTRQPSWSAAGSDGGSISQSGVAKQPAESTQYDAPKEVESTHRLSRFGRTDDFGVVLNVIKTGQWGKEQDEYIVGTAIGSLIIFIFAIIGFLVILVFRCLGQYNVGFLAGWFQHNVPKPAAHHSEASDVDEEACANESSDKDELQRLKQFQSSKKERKFNCRVNSIRIVFFVCGGLLIITLFLLYGKGIGAVRKSLNDVDYVVNWATASADDARSSIQSILTDKEPLVSQIDDISDQIQSCSTLYSDGRTIVTKVNTVRSTISQVVALIVDYFELADESLARVQEGVDGSQDQRKYGTIAYWVTVAVNTVMLVLVICMMAQTYVLADWKLCAPGIGHCNSATIGDGNMSRKEENVCCAFCYRSGNEDVIGNGDGDRGGKCRFCSKKCVRASTNTLILPLFIIFLLLSWLFSSVALIAAIAGADFCIKPDQHVLSVVDTFKDDMLSEYVHYYISGCAGSPPIQDLMSEFDSLVKDSDSTLEYFQSLPNQNIAATCSMRDYQATQLKERVGALDSHADKMYSDFRVVRDLIDCKKINPIYTRLVHNAMCINGVGGLTWVFATMLTIAIMAMLMLTFRAAIRPVKDIPVDGLRIDGDARSVGDAKLGEKPDIISRDVTRQVLMDGTHEITDVIKIRNADGTITEQVTTRTEEATEEPLEEAPTLPSPIIQLLSLDSTDMHRSHDSDPSEDLRMPQPVPPPQSKPNVIGRDVTRRVLEDGSHQITEVIKVRNVDGTIAEQVTSRTEEATKEPPEKAATVPPSIAKSFSLDSTEVHRNHINKPSENFQMAQTAPLPQAQMAGKRASVNIIGRDVTRRVLEDGSHQITERLEIQNEDGTITEQVTRRNEEATKQPPKQASATPPRELSEKASAMPPPINTELDKTHDKENPSKNLQMTLPTPPPQTQQAETATRDGIVLEKTTNMSISADGTTTQVTEVSIIQNPDGTLSKKTEVRNQ